MAEKAKIYMEPRMLLSIKETARRLGIAEQTIYNGISRRSDRSFPIKPKRWGKKVLFDSRDIEQFIENLPYDGDNALGR
jgi:predicted DNA-binding transcriptional regulator AlpA